MFYTSVFIPLNIFTLLLHITLKKFYTSVLYFPDNFYTSVSILLKRYWINLFFALIFFVVAILYNSNLIMKQVLLFLEATLWIEAQSFEAKISIKDKDRGDKSLLCGEMMP